MGYLLAIVVIHNDDNLRIWHEGLNLAGKFTDEGRIVVYAGIWDDINGEHVVIFRIQETMHLHNLFMGCKHVHDFRL